MTRIIYKPEKSEIEQMKNNFTNNQMTPNDEKVLTFLLIKTFTETENNFSKEEFRNLESALTKIEKKQNNDITKKELDVLMKYEVILKASFNSELNQTTNETLGGFLKDTFGLNYTPTESAQLSTAMKGVSGMLSIFRNVTSFVVGGFLINRFIVPEGGVEEEGTKNPKQYENLIVYGVPLASLALLTLTVGSLRLLEQHGYFKGGFVKSNLSLMNQNKDPKQDYHTNKVELKLLDSKSVASTNQVSYLLKKINEFTQNKTFTLPQSTIDEFNKKYQIPLTDPKYAKLTVPELSDYNISFFGSKKDAPSGSALTELDMNYKFTKHTKLNETQFMTQFTEVKIDLDKLKTKHVGTQTDDSLFTRIDYTKRKKDSSQDNFKFVIEV